MQIRYYSSLDSEISEIIRRRDENLISEEILEYALSKINLSDKEAKRFEKIFKLSTEIYDQIQRKSGEKYTQHTLRITKKPLDLNFCNPMFTFLNYTHDILETLRDPVNKNKFPKSYETEFLSLLTSSETMDLELLTPIHSTEDKQRNVRKIFSALRFTPIQIPGITKIFDIHDNSYDQKAVKPEGVQKKLDQLSVGQDHITFYEFYYIFRNPSPFFNQYTGFPTNLKEILKELIEDSIRNIKGEKKTTLEEKILLE